MSKAVIRLLIILGWVMFALAHALFVQFYLYWNILWLDSVMHGCGGALIVLTYYLIERAGLFTKFFSLSYVQPLVLLVVMMAGWELFKYSLGSITAPNYVLDTVLDTLAGLSGGLIVFWLFRSRTIKR